MSHDGHWVVSGSKDRGVQFWDSKTAVVQSMLQGHKNSGEFVFHSSCLPTQILSSHINRPQSHKQYPGHRKWGLASSYMVIQLVLPPWPSELYISIILLFFLAAPIPSFSFTTFLHVDVDHVLSLSSVSFSPHSILRHHYHYLSLPPSHLVGCPPCCRQL